jgi:hypothetical protein
MTETIKMTLELEFDPNRYVHRVGEDEWAPASIEDMVIQAAAEKVLEREVRNEIAGIIRDKVEDLAITQLRGVLEPLISDAISGGIGRGFGDKVPIDEWVTRYVEKQLTISNPNSGYPSQQTMLDKLLREEIDRTVGHELRQAIDEAKAQVRQAVKEKGAEVFAEVIERMAAR